MGRFLALLGILALSAFPQAQPQQSFEDLARSASATLDSNPAEAATLFRKALALRPEWSEGWLYLGGALYQSAQFAEATDALRKGVELAPMIANGWALLGLSEAELDNPEQALADIRKGEELGIASNPQFETAVRVKAARLLCRASAFDEATIQLQPLASRNENSPVVVETMGMSLLGEATDPATWSPERKAALGLAGRAAWSLVTHHPEEASSSYKELLAQHPLQSGVHYAYGSYLMETDLNGAIEQFQAEIQSNPKHWPSLLLLASLQVKKGDSSAALETLKAANKYSPARYRWLCHTEMGHAQMVADNLNAAIAELQTALKLSPNQVSVHFLLSQAYRRAGKKDEARKETSEFEKLKAKQDPLGVPGFGSLISR